MIDYEIFVKASKSIVVAPAGFGKTHTIAESLKYTEGKQLILTHTHSGIASIKEKLKKEKISYEKYNVETISGFAQKYVLAFYKGDSIPNQDDNKNYFPFILTAAIQLFKRKLINEILRKSYSGLFVDEYQDCTITQHQLILELSNILPTHILGDSLQGIFGFSGDKLVELDEQELMKDFIQNKFVLEKPWRWIVSGNIRLGNSLKEIRIILENKAIKQIDLSKFSTVIEIVKTDNVRHDNDLYTNYNKILREKLKKTSNNESLLIIHPESKKGTAPRETFIQFFGDEYFLIEAIDDKDFYKFAKVFDTVTKENINVLLRNFLYQNLTKTSLNNWFTDNGFKNKRDVKEKKLLEPIQTNFYKLSINPSFRVIAETLEKVYKLPSVRCYRKDLFRTICKALIEAEANQCSVYEAMKTKRNQIRRVGRKVYGKCIGTTLLTKGLEFDTVLILNAHKFDCRKNLYVALTRASKRLIIFTNDMNLKLNE